MLLQSVSTWVCFTTDWLSVRALSSRPRDERGFSVAWPACSYVAMKGTFGVSSVLVGDITLGEDSGFWPSLSLEASCSIHGQQIFFFFFFSGSFSLLRIVQKEFEKNFRMMCVVPCLQHCLFSIRDEKSRFCTYFKLITFLIAWLLLSLVLKENYYFYRSFCRFSNSVLMTKNKDKQTPFFVVHQLVCRWWISFMSLMLTLGLVT